MKETTSSFFGIESFSEVADRAGVRQGDSNPIDIMNLAIGAKYAKQISQMELLAMIYSAGRLEAINAARDTVDDPPLDVLSLDF